VDAKFLFRSASTQPRSQAGAFCSIAANVGTSFERGGSDAPDRCTSCLPTLHTCSRPTSTRPKGCRACQCGSEYRRGREKCGLNEDELRAAVLLPLRAYTKIHEWKKGDAAADANISVNIASLAGTGLCTFATLIEVVGKANFGSDPEPHVILLWHIFNVWTGPSDQSNSREGQLLEENARMLASDWQTANQ
jgi:hypothetical protein